MQHPKKILFVFTFFAGVLLGTTDCKKTTLAATPNTSVPPAVPNEWKFETSAFWQENFDYSGLPDPAKWGYDIGGNGWGNGELQYYTNSGNTIVDNGTLKIIAKKESFSGRNYTSARLVTKNKADWLYGRIEVKAKIPKGIGTWPAIWMLPTDNEYGGWPKSGEIDIMEHVGYDLNKVHFTIHTESYNHSLGTQKGSERIIATATDEFHLYRVDWASYGIRGYFDNELVFEFINPNSGSAAWPFDKKFHLLLNIAVGGSWGGLQGVNDSAFPATMEIDYIKMFRFLQ